jgi:single-strand DNA-binding protein
MHHKITLLGHLGRDPEMRYAKDGTPVTNFSMAIDDSYGENKKTIWVRVSVWRKQAESCNQYLRKGSQVYVEGRLGHENGNPQVFTRQDGTTGSSFEVTANVVKFLGSRGGTEQRSEQPERQETPVEIPDGNEIPF